MSASILELVGRDSGPVEFTWDERDARIYALGVGAASTDPTGAELTYVAPGLDGPPAVLPSFAVLAGSAARRLVDFGGIPGSAVVHAEQSIELLRPLAAHGRVTTVCRIDGVWDKGSGALISTEAVSTDSVTGETVFVNRSASFVKGAGGFGGPRGPAAASTPPERDPDTVIELTTRPDQALLYALSGDDNPLHWNPAFALSAGFPRPILHGLCTFGFAARALVSTVCDGVPGRMRDLSARFSAPVYPGSTLTVSVWRDPAGASFRVESDNAVVLDRGHCAIGSEDDS